MKHFSSLTSHLSSRKGFTRHKTAPGFARCRLASGFTLIELLIVIAVLGVLAGGILIAINPLEKIAKAKDSTKKSTVSQLTNALQSYYTLKGQGTYPPASSTWIQSLVDNGDLKNVPPPAGGTACATNNQNGYCYKTNADLTEAIVYTGIESSERPSGTSGTTPYILWSSATGESGTYYSVTSDVPDTVTTSGFTSGPASTLTQGLAGWWTMNGNASDSSGNSNNGTAKNGASSNGTAYIFDGSDDYVDLGNPVSLRLTESQTIAMWLYPTSFSTRRNPYAKAYGGEGTITQEPTGNVSYYDGTCGGNCSPYQGFYMTSSLSLNTWAHLVLVRDTPDKKLYWYKNGDKTNQITSSYPTAKASSLPAMIGKGYVSNYAGRIDDVRIYNRALTAGEVKNLYSAGPQ